MADKKLTAKQARFVEEYLIDLNATQAAIRAGYSKTTAYSIGHENLSKPEIIEAVTKAAEDRAARVKIDADYVLNQSVKLHERCMQEIAPFTDKKGNHIHDDEGRPLYVFNASGAAKALDLIGKHVDIQAFRDRVTVDGHIGITIDQDDADL